MLDFVDNDSVLTTTYPDPDGTAGPDKAPVVTFNYDADQFVNSIVSGDNAGGPSQRLSQC